MNIKYNKALWLIIILAIVMMIPFLGLTDFNTKGEPREAVVAYTMLEHGNWILPINNGGDIQQTAILPLVHRLLQPLHRPCE